MPFPFLKCQCTRQPGGAGLSVASPALSSSFMPLIRPQYKRRRSQLEARARTTPAL